MIKMMYLVCKAFDWEKKITRENNAIEWTILNSTTQYLHINIFTRYICYQHNYIESIEMTQDDIVCIKI